MVWKFCEIWKSYGNRLSEGPNSVRFYLTVRGMACMCLFVICWIYSKLLLKKYLSEYHQSVKFGSRSFLDLIWSQTVTIRLTAEDWMLLVVAKE